MRSLRRCVGVSGLRHSHTGSQKPARMFLMDINRMKTKYLQSEGSAEVRSEIVEQLSQMRLLVDVSGVDLKTIMHFSGALSTFKCPSSTRCVQEIGQWLQSFVASNSLQEDNAQSFVQSLFNLTTLNPTLANDVASTALPKLEAITWEMTPSTGAMLLRILRTDGRSSTLKPRAIQVSRSDIESLSLSDKVEVALCLAGIKSHSEAATSLLRTLSDETFSTNDAVMILPICAGESSLEGLTASSVRSVVDGTGSLLPQHIPHLFEACQFLKPELSGQIMKAVAQIGFETATVGDGIAILYSLKQETPKKIIDILQVALNSTEVLMKLTPRELRMLLLSAPSCAALIQSYERITEALVVAVCQSRSVSHIAAIITPDTLEQFGDQLSAAVSACVDSCSLEELADILTSVSSTKTKEARRMMREAAQRVGQNIHRASVSTMSEIACAYGRSGVRSDVLCTAIADRALGLASELSCHDISVILAFLASVEYRNNKVFLELVDHVKVTAPTATPTELTNLISAYSKALVWNFRLFQILSSRALELVGCLSLTHIIGILTSLNRVDVRNEALFKASSERVHFFLPLITHVEAIPLLVALSKSAVRDDVLYNSLGEKVIAAAQLLNAHQLGEVLMAFSRVGLVQHRIYDCVLLRVLAVAPTCPPLPIANIATAYASVGLRHEELFSILAERTLVIKDDCPAVVLGAFLAAVASLGIRNDKLFIEMITRVRHVPTYGTPQDIVNVVVAYSTVNVWHYRLFARLADRAVQLRGEFRGSLIAQLVSAYAKVDMKYDKLFAEFSPRIQACAPTMEICHLVEIAEAYSRINIADDGVFCAIGDVIARKADALTSKEKKILMESYGKVGLVHNGLASALSGLPAS